jgi:hypothetical protein
MFRNGNGSRYLLITIAVVVTALIFYLLYFLLTTDGIDFSRARACQPIFDGYVNRYDLNLKLDDCYCWDVKPVRKPIGLSDVPPGLGNICRIGFNNLTGKRMLKSKKFTVVRESWKIDWVIVCSWHFQYEEDAVQYPDLKNGYEHFSGFSGWSSTSDIGDHTCRAGDILYFAKGKVFVKVMVTSKPPGEDFIGSVAARVAERIQNY